MRRRSLVTAVAVALILAVGSGPAFARPAPKNLRWMSPPSVSDGVPATFASIKPCPTTRPDGSAIQGTLSVFISITFSFGGGMTQGPFSVAPDGSWVANATFNAGGFSDPDATVQATCQDVTFTGTLVGSYKPHPIAVNP